MNVVLTIAGSDSGGGAGIQADLKTFEAHGVFGTSAITSITAQNTVGVRMIFDLPVDLIRAQIDAVFDDLPVAAVKIGMLSTAAVIHRVADMLERHAKGIPIVLDPVMVASSGDRLLRQDAVESLIERLIPLSTLVTPNRAEAGVLAKMETGALEATRTAAYCIHKLTGGAVLVTGGDPGARPSPWAEDILFDGGRFRSFRAPRVGTGSCHGTGCTLSSAIAANLATGMDLTNSIRLAKDYVHHAIVRAPGIGRGSAPLRHSL